jgi:hypothetical protein
MTQEAVKFMFNLMYRHIAVSSHSKVSFGQLVDWARLRKIDDETFLSMIDGMEKSGLVIRQGEIYSIPDGSRVG